MVRLFTLTSDQSAVTIESLLESQKCCSREQISPFIINILLRYGVVDVFVVVVVIFDT